MSKKREKFLYPEFPKILQHDAFPRNSCVYIIRVQFPLMNVVNPAPGVLLHPYDVTRALITTPLFALTLNVTRTPYHLWPVIQERVTFVHAPGNTLCDDIITINHDYYHL